MKTTNILPSVSELASWGEKEFCEQLKFEDYTLSLKKDSHFIDFFKTFNLCYYLNNIAKDLIHSEFHIDEDDKGKVLLIEFSNVTLVAKKVKKDLNAFHEFFIADLLSERQIHTITPIGIYKEHDEKADSYLLAQLIANSLSLHQVLCKPNLLYTINPHIKNLKKELIEISIKLGEALNLYILSGIIHQELDFKNICLSYDDVYFFHFIDFERTKYFTNPPNINLLKKNLVDAINRRLKRYELKNEWLTNFVNGYFSAKHYSLSSICNLCKNLVSEKGIQLFLIDGFAASGKTSISEELQKKLKKSTIIETDWFIRYSRTERNASTYLQNNHFLWYDIERLQIFVNRLLTQKTIKEDKLYNHFSGIFDYSVDITIDHETVIIIEGMYSSICVIESLKGVSVFLDAKKKILLQRFSFRDSLIRNIDPELTLNRFASINGDSFNTFRLKFSKKAHVLLNTDSFEQIKIVNLNRSLFVDFL